MLIRHGESVGNATRTISHFRTCGGLSDAGRAQCELLAKRLDRTGELTGAVLYASHVRRAVETAEFVAPVIGAEIRIDERFAELDPGDECDGMTYDDLLARFSPDWTMEDPDGVIYPGGETVAALHTRVAAALDSVIAAHPGELVAICTHGGVVDVAMRIGLRPPGARLVRPVHAQHVAHRDDRHRSGQVADRSLQRRRPPARRVLAVTPRARPPLRFGLAPLPARRWRFPRRL